MTPPPAPPSQIWVEKYRPRGISDVTHQDEVISTLQKAVKESAGRGDLPHLLFYGPPGTGKTSTALALVRDLFGPTQMRSRVLELNASDERGIKVVRDKIKTFAQTTVPAVPKELVGKYPCPPFKVIILDEADAITVDAQTALRRTMETYSKVTRFILICNYISRIIGPLTSRCAKFRFQSVPMGAMLGHLKKIAEAEGVRIGDETLAKVIKASSGDLRRAINTLQSAHKMGKKGSDLEMDVIETAACLVPEQVVAKFEKVICGRGRWGGVRGMSEEMIQEGYSVLQLFSQLGDRLLEGEGMFRDMNDLQRGAVGIAVARAEKALIEGGDEFVQLLNLAATVWKIKGMGEDVSKLVGITSQS